MLLIAGVIMSLLPLSWAMRDRRSSRRSGDFIILKAILDRRSGPYRCDRLARYSKKAKDSRVFLDGTFWVSNVDADVSIDESTTLLVAKDDGVVACMKVVRRPLPIDPAPTAALPYATSIKRE